jgi:NADH-quinone oxidoreductase subunit A
MWRRFSNRKNRAGKNATYEWGESLGEARVQFQSHYYLYCIIFRSSTWRRFSVPFAVAFTGLPIGAFIAILVFLLLLMRTVWPGAKAA